MKDPLTQCLSFVLITLANFAVRKIIKRLRDLVCLHFALIWTSIYKNKYTLLELVRILKNLMY